VLTGGGATVAATLAALDGAGQAHLAAHGRFRADNPLFSSLELHDGALTVFDLERLRRAPRRLLLTACDAGLSAVRPGDEVMGLVATLLELGTATVIASVLPVPDRAVADAGVRLHRALAAGTPPAEALAAGRLPLECAGLGCFGAG
jgi:CHAT domain-containing protein